MADDLLRLVLNHIESEVPSPIIVSGPVGSGKTKLSQEVVERLVDEDYRPGGVLSPRLMDSGETVGYDVVDLATGDVRSFVRLHPPGKRLGKFYVKPGALEFANRAISEAGGNCDPVFVDEIGRLELENDGLAPSLRGLLDSKSLPILLVRDEFVPEVREVFELNEYGEIILD